MYDTLNILNIDKTFILSRISEYDLFSNYMGFRPEIGKLYLSPLRKDTKPSFSLYVDKNNSLRYKDFGTGENGDCFDFISKLCNENSFPKLLSKIYKGDIKPFESKKTISPPLLPKIEKRLGINKINFNEEGLHYWKQYGLNLNTLLKFDVTQVNRLYVNNELVDRYKKGNPIFAYNLYDRLKIYKPLESIGSRFYSDCNLNYIQGWKQIDTSKDLLIITKSLKDIMVLYELGYTSIAANGEGYDFPPKAIKFIKSKFKKIVLLYDRDTTGVKNTRKLVNKYGFDFTLIPKKYNTKDISDFYYNFGKTETVKLLQTLLKINEHEQRN